MPDGGAISERARGAAYVCDPAPYTPSVLPLAAGAAEELLWVPVSALCASSCVSSPPLVRALFDLRPLGLRLRDGASQLDPFPPFVIGDIRRRDTLHPEDLDFIAVTPG